ncbi:transcriptional regulator [Mangrovactinospora gilvigrisea]|uniref:Transcriptional regulator n=1 Tax=Mangrovactinospora gilvigrisea TaxID=1428644 RepID=A0A1J7C5J7_9ACTN|nr:LCP family protein [Mangrovactinospora gilvigrisea]OIV36824.1 transcriptional regulator [Mangrovactinospora gilvigrisea]
MARHRKTRGGARGPGRPRRLGRRIALVVCAVLVVLGGAGGFAYYKLDGNLHGVDIDKALGKDRPKKVDNGAENILVLGSDSRSGANGAYGRDEGSARSDTAMVLHLAKGRKSGTLISIPRDTLVDRPSCTAPNGSTTAAASGVMFNSAYSAGGPACSVKTVEKLTGVRMDHFVEIDFAGFTKVVDALGGVTVDIPQDIDDNDSHLHITKGVHKLDGKQALGLVRTRHGVGDGSDLGRIKLQQLFIRSLMKQVESSSLLTSPTKLYRTADAATKTVTTDSGLDSLSSLTSFARSMSGLTGSRLKTVTMPVQYDPSNPNRVIPINSEMTRLWTAVQHDRPVPAVKGTAE